LFEFYNFVPMQKSGTPGEAYPGIGSGSVILPGTENEISNFKVNYREFCHKQAPYNRRDYFKISLIIGTGKLHFADRTIGINRNALVFFNPRVPYSWEATSEKQSGYFCLFTPAFIDAQNNSLIRESPLVQTETDPVYFVDKKGQQHLVSIFEKMLSESDSDYSHKYDLLRNYVNLIIHEALKLKPGRVSRYNGASKRITSLFIELLERQFPVDSLAHSLKLKTANDYAIQLGIHPNHLNRAVKETTGKTITAHISDRVVREAKALLAHTNWSVSEIAYALGFENPPYFNNFFKKQTRFTPNSMRK
jgi:AraC family transcriptional activator of pobA